MSEVVIDLSSHTVASLQQLAVLMPSLASIISDELSRRAAFLSEAECADEAALILAAIEHFKATRRVTAQVANVLGIGIEQYLTRVIATARAHGIEVMTPTFEAVTALVPVESKPEPKAVATAPVEVEVEAAPPVEPPVEVEEPELVLAAPIEEAPVAPRRRSHHRPVE